MGNISISRRAVDYLRDPFLVRRIQEQLGVKQIADHNGFSDAPSPPRRPGSDDEASGAGSGVSAAASAAGNGLVNGYRWLSSKSRKRVKSPESSSPASSEMVVEIYPLLNIFFRLATELGHEPFYITYFPFLVWNADTALGRHTVMVWCISTYVAQACKALFKWKRPACPPAIRLVTNPVLETEYGLPSTHATVATTVPFYSLYFLYYRYNLSLWFGLPAALFWCLSVCLSRVYLGVHTVLVRKEEMLAQ
jgi:sphingosine-1-phosphate phosphatase 1